MTILPLSLWTSFVGPIDRWIGVLVGFTARRRSRYGQYVIMNIVFGGSSFLIEWEHLECKYLSVGFFGCDGK